MTDIIRRGFVEFGTDGDDIFTYDKYSEGYRFIGGDGTDVLLIEDDSANYTGGSGWIQNITWPDYGARYFGIEILRFDDRDVLVADLPNGEGVTLLGDQNPDQLADEIEYSGRDNLWVDTGRRADRVVQDALDAGTLVANLGWGDDRLESNAWAATVHAGRGDDVVDLFYVTDDTARVFGGLGDDRLRVAKHYQAFVDGGAGDDRFHAAGTLKGGRGDDTFLSWWHEDGSTIDGGDGVDRVIARTVPDSFELTYDDVGDLTYVTTIDDGAVVDGEFIDLSIVSTFVFTDIEIFVDSTGARHRVDGRPIGFDDVFRAGFEKARTVDAAKLLANDALLADLDAEIVRVKNAEHGTVELVGDEITFTPDDDFSGRAGFDYIVRNELGRDKVHVTVRVKEAVIDPDDPWPYDDASAHHVDHGLF